MQATYSDTAAQLTAAALQQQPAQVTQNGIASPKSKLLSLVQRRNFWMKKWC